jgi:hypothetical protein
MAKRKTAEEGAVTRAAVSIGNALGNAAAKFDAWLEQRDAVAKELTAVIGKAQGMLSSIITTARQSVAARTAKPARKAAKKPAKSSRQTVFA